MQNYLVLLGRIFIALIFLFSVIGKIFGFTGTQQFMASYGMPMPWLFLLAAIILELVGSLSILLGYKVKLGSIALLIFLVPATIIFHTNFSDQIQLIMFLKNIAIIGGLLLIIAYGAGRISLDERAKVN